MKDNTMAKGKQDNRTHTDLLSTTQKTKDKTTRTPLKEGASSCILEG